MIVAESARLSNVEDLHKKCKKIIYKQIFLNCYHIILRILIMLRWIQQHLAIIRSRKPVISIFGIDRIICILINNWKKRIDVIRSYVHHVSCNIYSPCTGRDRNLYKDLCNRWIRIYDRWITVDRRFTSDGTWTYGCSFLLYESFFVFNVRWRKEIYTCNCVNFNCLTEMY